MPTALARAALRWRCTPATGAPQLLLPLTTYRPEVFGRVDERDPLRAGADEGVDAALRRGVKL